MLILTRIEAVAIAATLVEVEGNCTIAYTQDDGRRVSVQRVPEGTVFVAEYRGPDLVRTERYPRVSAMVGRYVEVEAVS